MNSQIFRGRYSLLLVLFVLSGFSGLIYQSIWSHYLGLFLGHAAYAQSLVLALFMGGMALGAWLVAGYGERWRNLVRIYALVELVVGLFGLGFHWIFTSALGLSYDVIMPALGETWLVAIWKWLLAASLILPQTVLLGMTFPLMSGGVIRRWPDRDGRVLGGLYFTNSLGAAVGVLCAAFLLLPKVGMPGAMIAAGAINLIVASIAWWLSRGAEPAPLPTDKDRTVRDRSGRALLYVVLGATFLSSAASFAYEIIFVRMLSLAVGATLHAFELMLAAFIAGIALGAYWIRNRAETSSCPVKLASIMQIMMGLTALLALALYSTSFSWVGFLMDSLAQSEGGYGLFNLGTAAISILIMLPTAFFAGTTLPLFTVALLRDGQGEPSIGRVYAFNTVGAIVGVFGAVHVLIPLLGVKLALICAAMVDIAIGVFLIRWLADRRRDFVRVGAALAVMIGAMWVSVNLVVLDPLKLSSGVYRTGNVQLSPLDEVVFYRDGKTASVSVTAKFTGLLTIATDGKPDASMQTLEGMPPTADEPTMIMAGTLPFAYTQDFERAAVIGFGSGMTTHTLLSQSGLERVDTIEIEEQMVKGARWFGERVSRAYNDERSRIIIDDAKSFFSGQNQKYGIIVSEPSNPWISGVGALFAKEFYEFIPRHLSDGGLFVQWLQLYEIDERLVGSVLNALLPRFEDVHAYLANSGDLLMLASQRPLEANPEFERLVEGEQRLDLEHVGIDSGAHLAFRRVADKPLLEALARLYKNEANSYYSPILSLKAPSTRFQNLSPRQFVRLPYLDVPLLEWLGVRAVPSETAFMPQYGHFPADDLANEAKWIARAITNPGSASALDLNEDLTEFAASVTATSQICAERSNETTGLWIGGRLKVLVNRVLPYLPPQGLEGVLINPAWLECEQLPQGVGQAVALVEAYAARDVVRMETKARQWLESIEDRPTYLEGMDEVAFASLQFSLIGQERYAEARDAEEDYGSLVKARGDYGFARSLLLAWLDGK